MTVAELLASAEYRRMTPAQQSAALRAAALGQDPLAALQAGTGSFYQYPTGSGVVTVSQNPVNASAVTDAQLRAQELRAGEDLMRAPGGHFVGETTLADGRRAPPIEGLPTVQVRIQDSLDSSFVSDILVPFAAIVAAPAAAITTAAGYTAAGKDLGEGATIGAAVAVAYDVVTSPKFWTGAPAEAVPPSVDVASAEVATGADAALNVPLAVQNPPLVPAADLLEATALPEIVSAADAAAIEAAAAGPIVTPVSEPAVVESRPQPPLDVASAEVATGADAALNVPLAVQNPPLVPAADLLEATRLPEIVSAADAAAIASSVGVVSQAVAAVTSAAQGAAVAAVTREIKKLAGGAADQSTPLQPPPKVAAPGGGAMLALAGLGALFLFVVTR